MNQDSVLGIEDKQPRLGEPFRCPECKSQLVIAPVQGKPNTVSMLGCNCHDRQEFFIPDGIIAFGPDHEIMSLYYPRIS